VSLCSFRRENESASSLSGVLRYVIVREFLQPGFSMLPVIFTQHLLPLLTRCKANPGSQSGWISGSLQS
jgi:hypothetical protein